MSVRRARAWAEAHPLLAFFLVTFTASWCFWVPSAVLYAGAESAGDLVRSPPFVVLQTLGAAAPSATALLLVRALLGRAAVRGLLGRLRPRRRWAAAYLVAAAAAPLLTMTALAVRSAVTGTPLVAAEAGLSEMAADMGWVEAVAVLPLVLLAQTATSPLVEELGWHGYALPRLQSRLSALVASLVLGLLWGLWHLPLVVAYDDAFGPYLAGILGHTILMTWLSNSTEGDLVTMLLFHAGLNVSFTVLAAGPSDWATALVVWAAVLVLLMRFGGATLSARPRVVEPATSVR